MLTQQFGVPPENLMTQGYGEQYLKVPTQGRSAHNRRVTVRRITPLLDGAQRRAAAADRRARYRRGDLISGKNGRERRR